MPVPYYRIDLNPVLASFEDLQNEPFLAVTPESPIKLRREVERFGMYFRREFNFDFVQFVATEKPESGKKPYAAPRWAAQWMWLHPYLRGKGILTRAWDKFHNVYGNFMCEPPFSPAMEAFLRKRGNCIFCWQALDTPEGVICTRCDAEHKGSQG